HTPNAIRQKNSLARNFRDVVEEFIHRLKAKIRHPDRIDVGITKRDAQLRAALQHPAVFRGELSFIAFDNSSHQGSGDRSRESGKSFLTPDSCLPAPAFLSVLHSLKKCFQLS